MSRKIFRNFRSLLRDERGNIFILFGAALVPMVLLLGGAVDLTRYNRYKADLSNAVDAAALSLARQGRDMTAAQAKIFVGDYVNALGVYDDQFALIDYTVEKTSNGFYVDADATMKTIFLPIGVYKGASRLNSMEVDVAAQVVHSSNRLELALVLDNTGSMNCGATVSGSCTGNWMNPGVGSRISGLKNAAHTLVGVLMDQVADPEMIKIALVPFEGSVNIKGAGFDESWVDWSPGAVAKASQNGRNFDQYDFGPGLGPKNVGHRRLFEKLGVPWAGCVEMRAGSYELSDAAPDSSVPDSLFVPYFWPDEPDDPASPSSYYFNNYLNDQIGGPKGTDKQVQKNLKKYGLGGAISWRSASYKAYAQSTSAPHQYGPNRGCPRPVVPLTNNRVTIDAEIDKMVAFGGVGTFIAPGLYWGWNVLTPGAPYSEGLGPSSPYYDRTVKAIVLLSDGENSVTGLNNPNRSTYSAYNYVSEGRLGSTTSASVAEDTLNAKTAELCGSVKAAEIRLYTITFGSIPAAAQSLMKNCASVDKGSSLYYHAPSNSELEAIFNQIGQDLSEIHLSM